MGEPLDVTNLEPGTVLLDKYRVVETLGIGGMGVVVCVDHITLETRVALKFLLPKLLSNANVAKRFMREARAATRIASPHVCKVLDVDTMPEGPPFMVMEYLEGEDLAFLVDSGRRFAIEEAIDLIAQAAEALAQAHRKGIVHRDVKPANLFLVERGEEPPLVKVLDFGISKVTDEGDWSEQAALTKTTAVLGSGLYMSPEQMRSAKNVDNRTDIYALGVCLFELLSHTQPYVADSFAELCVKVSTEPPDSLRLHRPDVPEPLAQVIALAYAAKPDERYQSIAEFVEALAPFALPHTQVTISNIIALGDVARRTSPSLHPPAMQSGGYAAVDTGAHPTADTGAHPTGRSGPGHTTAEAAALATTAAVEGPARSRVGLVVGAAGLLLALIVGVFAFVALRYEATPASDAGPVTALPDPIDSATTATTAPSDVPEPNTGTEESEEVSGSGDAGPDGAASPSATAAPKPTVTRTRPRPRPKSPRIIREGDLCFKVYPDKGGFREMVTCP